MNDESETDDTSLEIYLALVDQLSEEDLAKQRLRMMQEKHAMQMQKQQMAIMPRRPQQLVKVRPIEKPPVLTDITDEVEPTVTFFDNMVKEFQRKEAFVRGDSEDGEILEDLIRVEEIFIATMLAKCLKLCPSAFENEITKDEIMGLINRASRFLWTSVGGTLEHYLLWWAQFPLACRPASCTKYLREYLMLIQPDDAPEPILSTLKSLGEILTVHAGEYFLGRRLNLFLVCLPVGTTWDKDFRICLVLSSLKVDQVFDKNSVFYVAEEQVS